MKEKINIAKILKDKPQGTKLYSSACGKCELKEAEDKSFKVSFYSSKFGFMNGGEGIFDKNGKLYDDGECVVFPSKEMRDWSKFAWKKGDVLVNSSGFKLFFDRWANDDYTRFFGKVNLLEDSFSYETEKYTLASKEKTLDILEIEKPEFKDGDIAFADYGNRQDVFIVSGITGLSEGYSSFISIDLSSLTLSMGCRTSFFKKDLCKLRLATDSEKKQLFDALEKEGKAWDSNKKQVVDLKPKVELKPFDKVLSRRCSEDYWVLNFYSHKTDYYHICIDGSSNLYCIPYNEGTAHLLGTTDDWEGGEQ